MTTEVVHEQKMHKKIKKQMGCMSGFLQIFDRHQLLSGKRLYTKRLPAPKGDDVFLETEKFSMSPENSKDKLIKSPQVTRSMSFPILDLYKQPSMETRSPAVDSSLPVEMPPKSPLPLPLFDVNEGGRNSWKFSPRLSLDSRATFDDAKGSLYRKQMQTNLSANRCDKSECGTDSGSRRSTSVIAKLMGIETLPNSRSQPVAKQAGLRRSASESRVSRDIFKSRMVENNHNDIVKVKQQNHVITSNIIRENNFDQSRRGGLNQGLKSPQQRKSFFNSAVIFPEPTQNVSIYGEIERRLKMRGIDEPSKDLETLKQILEAMQLKGLLHSNPTSRVRNKNIVYVCNFSHSSSEAQSPIVLMKPLIRRVSDKSPPSNVGSNSGNRVSSISPRRQRQSIDRNANSPVRARNLSSPTPTEFNARSSNTRSNSPVKSKQLTVETQRRGNESVDSRKVSPRISPRRNVAEQAVTNRPQIIRRQTEDEFLSSISESSVSTPSQTDTERFKATEYKEGRKLLDRCDKLLNSIAEMNAAESQPSPVSVLDTSYYKDDSSLSPSPVIKQHISFPVELDELGSPGISSVLLDCEDGINDSDFIYIFKVIKAWNLALEEANDHIFLQLEKQHYMKNEDTSKVSKLQRRLIFDTVTEIMEQKRNLPPWKALAIKNWNTSHSRPLVQQIWSEFQRIREQQSSDDLFEVICGVLKKDLSGEAINRWGDFPSEMSEAVLDIERLIFKDLVGESIRDLEESAAKRTYLAPCRKLVF